MPSERRVQAQVAAAAPRLFLQHLLAALRQEPLLLQLQQATLQVCLNPLQPAQLAGQQTPVVLLGLLVSAARLSCPRALLQL